MKGLAVGARAPVMAAGLAGLLSSAPGCVLWTSRSEGRVLQQQVAALKTQLDQRAAREHELDDKLGRLNTALDRATLVLERNSADLGLSVEKLKTQMAQIEGRLDDTMNDQAALGRRVDGFRADLQTRLDQLASTVSTIEGPPIPATADAVYAAAEKSLAAADWRDARRLFQAFTERYPLDSRAHRAWYEIGVAYAGEKLWANAIRTWSSLLDRHPAADIEADAMYQSGVAFFALTYCKDGRVYFQQLLKRHPDTTWKPDVREQLRRLDRAARDKAACTN